MVIQLVRAAVSENILLNTNILQNILGTVLLDCVNQKNIEKNYEDVDLRWCESANEIEGIIFLILGMFFLGTYIRVILNDDNTFIIFNTIKVIHT